MLAEDVQAYASFREIVNSRAIELGSLAFAEQLKVAVANNFDLSHVRPIQLQIDIKLISNVSEFVRHHKLPQVILKKFQSR